MGICSYEQFWITCDGDGCHDEINPDDCCESRDAIEEISEEDGWKRIGGLWFCPACAEKKGQG